MKDIYCPSVVKKTIEQDGKKKTAKGTLNTFEKHKDFSTIPEQSPALYH